MEKKSNQKSVVIFDQNERRARAATIIQRAWRRYIDVQVFNYYKGLVIFHNEGDPALIMRYINPNEAKLIDSASGIYIKFRLAGNQFPPTIYYKIYTHRPIQDICANAPRDYTKVKQKTAAMKNNRIIYLSDADSMEGWYRRIENNGWRPVSNKHLLKMNVDYYYGTEAQQKTVEFKHSKLMRKQDIEKKRKEKKIEWMQVMYKNGLLKAKGNTTETKRIVEEATLNLMKAYEEDGASSIEEWEVDELIEWTNGLNYDDYTNNWKTIGTTAHSDKFISEQKRLKYEGQFNKEIEESLENLARKHSIITSSTPLHMQTKNT